MKTKINITKCIFCLITGLLYFHHSNVFGQEKTLAPEIEKIIAYKIENYSEQTESEFDITDLISHLEYYLKHPIDLNHTDAASLQKLDILNDIQIKNLLDHIAKNGKLLSIYELQSVEGFDAPLIEILMPFVEVNSNDTRKKFNFRDITRYSTNDIMIRYQRILEKQKGYNDVSDSVRQLAPGSYYLGSPGKMYLKYRFNYFNNIKIGLTAEKDAGEEFFKGSNPYGFDFYSGYININNLGILKTLVIGDYALQFGQGLTLWSGISFGKSTDAVGIKKVARGITPSNSVYETGFMRGTAFTLAYKNLTLSGFYSSKKLDGNLISDTLEGIEPYISSLPEDGQHNTLLSIAKEKTLTEQLFGGHVGYKTRALDIGITAYGIIFDNALHKKYEPYNQFEFSGDKNYNAGLHYSYVHRNFNLFGETSLSLNGGIATCNGIMASINRYASFVVSYRYYQPKYQSLYSAAFGQSNHSYNESGIYSGIVIKPHYKITFSGYADLYHYPWMKYQANGPSSGYDVRAMLQYNPTKKIVMEVRYKFENSEKNTDDEDAMVEYLVAVKRQNYRFNIAYPLSNTVSAGNRAETSQYKTGGREAEWGYYLAQDLRYRSASNKCVVTLRYCVFDTPSYASRIFAYENDVLYAYSLPSFYDKGMRFYALLQVRAGRHISVWLRVAQTRYANKTTVSSGPNEIAGSHQSELKAQLRVTW